MSILKRGSIVIAVTLLVICTSSFVFGGGDPAALTVIGWNVESGGATASVIASRIANFENVDLWGLSEVANAVDAEQYRVAAGVGENADFESVLGTTGGGDRLLILYNAARFEKVGQEELTAINVTGTVRAPLVVHLRNLGNGQEFRFLVNHLARGNDAARHLQATMLNDWAEQEPLPVIAVGDYNFDFEVVNGDQDHDQGYDNMIDGSVFEWVRPATLVRTQCTGSTCSFNSVLDFVFVSGVAQDWEGESEIIVVAGDFPDDSTTSDHRPVIVTFQMETSITADVTKQDILDKIAEIEAELTELKALVEQLP